MAVWLPELAPQSTLLLPIVDVGEGLHLAQEQRSAAPNRLWQE
jgi:hypothetical protein